MYTNDKKIIATGFTITDNKYVEENDYESNPDDEYSRPNTHTYHELSDAKISEPNSVPDCYGSFEVEQSGTYHLVYLVYSSGDSFAHDSDSEIVFIEMFKTLEKAHRCKVQIENFTKLINLHESYHINQKDKAKAILELESKIFYPSQNQLDELHSKQNSEYNRGTLYYLDENDNIKSEYISWTGYFESLSYVSIESFDINLDIKKRIKNKL
jgi:hypothetical protein